MFIEDTNDLIDFLDRAQKTSSVLAIDTEFLREKTYYPVLCLLQMATEQETVIVDPFKIDDMHCMASILEDEHVVKLFHAATQDIEILYRETGVMPHPVFDTQIAAALLGHSQQMGYGALVQSECGVRLRKTDSYTDWSRRPLSASQIDYAGDDVLYLPKMYRSMTSRLQSMGRMSWLTPDFEHLCDPSRYDAQPRERYRRLKRVSQLNRRQLSAAREVAAWREERAQSRDRPRKWVLTDEQVVESCKREARTIDSLYMVRGLQDKLSTSDARSIITCIARGLDLPEAEWPKSERGARNETNVDVQVDLMMALVRLRARENDIASQTLASQSELVKLARGHGDQVDIMHGWRREIVGNELQALLDGSIALSMDGSNLCIHTL